VEALNGYCNCKTDALNCRDTNDKPRIVVTLARKVVDSKITRCARRQQARYTTITYAEKKVRFGQHFEDLEAGWTE
jgi:hypothetical protein